MSRAVSVAMLLALAASPSFAQSVKITLTDGSVHEGEYQGFENGRYRIQVQGAIREFEDARVLSVSLAGTPPPPAPRPPAVRSAADEIREALQRGAFEAALERIRRAREAGEAPGPELDALASAAFPAYVRKALEQPDPARLAEALGRAPGALADPARLELTPLLIGRLAELVRAASNDPGVLPLAAAVSRFAEAGPLSDALRETLCDAVIQLGNREFERKDFTAAAGLYRSAVKVDPRRAPVLKDRMVEALLSRARRQVQAKDTRGALESAREAAAADPEHAEARRFLEDTDFLAIQQEVDASIGTGAVESIRQFMSRAPRKEHRDWAGETLRRIESGAERSGGAGVSGQLARYFPARPGQFVLYQRTGEDAREKIRIDALVREGETVRVFFTREEIYRNASTPESYTWEVEKETVYLPTGGGEREPILKLPLRAGESWSWTRFGQAFRRTVKAAGETVVVGTGDRLRRFEDCVVVEFTSTPERGGPVRTSRSTYAPDVGLIRLEYVEAGSRKYSLEYVDHGNERN